MLEASPLADGMPVGANPSFWTANLLIGGLLCCATYCVFFAVLNGVQRTTCCSDGTEACFSNDETLSKGWKRIKKK